MAPALTADREATAAKEGLLRAVGEKREGGEEDGSRWLGWAVSDAGSEEGRWRWWGEKLVVC
jgi:hypothetical protein